MADLRALLTSRGFNNVITYIQRGNIILETNLAPCACEIEIKTAITDQYGWEVPVVVLQVSEMATIIIKYPFKELQKEKSYFTLLQTNPDEKNSIQFNTIEVSEEDFKVLGRCVYFFSTKSAARVKINNNYIERKLKVKATIRNFRTMAKLIELATV